MKSDQEDNEESKVLIDTTINKKKPSKKKPIPPEELPVVGQKRLRPSKPIAKKSKKGNDEEEDEPSQEPEDGEEGSEDLSSQPVKKRKLAGDKEKVVRPKKVQKMPTVFKKGKWNPDV